MTPESIIFMRAGMARGLFINQVAYIEKKIEYFIAFHFCRDKKRANEMIDFLTGDRFVSFESKRSALLYILERHHTEFYNKNKSNFELLTTIQNERNKMAHLVVNVTPDSIKRFELDGSFGLIKYTKDAKPVWYTEDKLKDIMKKVDDIAKWIDDLIETTEPPRI